MRITDIKQSDLDMILAALRFYQAFLETGEPPTGDQLKMISEIAEANGYPVTPDRIDELCELINTNG